MKINFKPKDPFHLTDEEIDQLQIHSEVLLMLEYYFFEYSYSNILPTKSDL